MAAQTFNLGSSLPVPCVQELVAKELLTTVPPRYVQTEQEPPFTSNHSASLQVPVIDMAKLTSGCHLELEKLHFSCRDWGFFQLINHEVTSSLVEKMKTETHRFFNLTMEKKKMLWQSPKDAEGFGQAFVVSEEQKLDWGDMFYLTTLPTNYRKPHLFPNLPTPLREALDCYSVELEQVGQKILDFIAKALKMKAEEMRELFDGGTQFIRMNYYPPCPQPEKVMGLKQHTDGGGLTILMQINEMDGLQVKKDGIWIPVTPIPGAFVINIGDMLQIITNGAYPSIEHRAVVNSNKERLSIAIFYTPGFEKEIGPAPSLVNPKSPALYKRIGVEDYLKGMFSRELKGRSNVDKMRIESSSPNS